MGGHQSWAYKHWGCVTPKQIQNLNKAIENNLDYLDGYAELDPSFQLVVEKALKEGHVDDSDWRGDVEQNRPGIKGVRKTALKKKPSMEQTEADADRTASRPDQIKRGRDNTNQDANNGHANGRPIIEIKTASKRSKYNLEKDTDAAEPPTKKLKSAPKKTKKAQAGVAESEPKSDKDPPKRKKAESEKIDPLVERKEVSSEHVTAFPPGLSSRRPRRDRAAVSKIGPEANETRLESNASESEDSVRERRAQRRRKKAGVDVRKTKNASVRAARSEV